MIKLTSIIQNKESLTTWYDKNRKWALAMQNKYQSAHKEQTRKASRRSYLKHREKRLAETSAYHKANKSQYNAYAKKYYVRRASWVSAYLDGHPCVDCGIQDNDVLEFDHVRGEKLFTIGGPAGSRRAINTLEAEVAKCDVRCANCHKKRHAIKRRESTDHE